MRAIGIERGVKLVVPPGFRLPDLVTLAPKVVPGTPERRDLRTTYWDTEDLRLARWGCSLRHRAGEGWTVKLPIRGATDGALVRDERTFDGAASVPPALALDLVRAPARGHQVRPVARLRTRRTAVPLVDADGRHLGLLALDEVAVLDGRRIGRRFAEVEVELGTDGRPRLLRRAVSFLQRAGAGETITAPKLARALDLEPPEERAAEPAGPGASAHRIVGASLSAAAAQLVEADPHVRLGEDPEAVHRARVAVRRLRADIRTFEPLLEPDPATELGRRLRPLARQLGAVRDAEVLLARLTASAATLGDADVLAARRLLARLEDERERARSDLLGTMRSEAYDELLDRLVGFAAEPPVRARLASQPATRLAPRVLGDAWSQLRAAVEGCGARPSDEELHGVRIRAKRVRYACEALAPAIGKRARSAARAAARLQEVLGEHHDAVVARDWLRGHASGSRTAFAAGRLAEREELAGNAARAAWRPAWDRLRRRASSLGIG